MYEMYNSHHKARVGQKKNSSKLKASVFRSSLNRVTFPHSTVVASCEMKSWPKFILLFVRFAAEEKFLTAVFQEYHP